MRYAFLTLAVLAGCGDASTGNPNSGNDPNTINYSGPVTIRLDKFKNDDVRNNAFDSDKDINSESGNPYGAFLQAARQRLGRDPAAVLVDRITLTIGEGTRGVTGFEQVLGGPLVVYFAKSGATVNVGTLTQPMGAGPVEVTITATRDTLAPLANEMRTGGFKVGIRVPAAAGRPASFDLKISTVLYFRALIV